MGWGGGGGGVKWCRVAKVGLDREERPVASKSH